MQVIFKRVRTGPGLFGNSTNEREVTVLNIVHGTSDPVDSYIEKAEYTDTGMSLTDDECNQLADQIADKIAEDFYQELIGKAEYNMEGLER